MGSSSLCNDGQELLFYPSTQQEYFSKRHCSSCSRTRGVGKMTFFKRCLIVFFLQIGCLALDHSTRELAYEEDEIRLIVGNHFPAEPINGLESSSDAENDQSPGNAIISFHPRIFDFKESPVGMPRLGVVRVDNRLKEENLKLISISGNTVHFQSSFFADKVITPGNNTTFEVVFLSREEGRVESSLYIHTSKGLFKYHVRGVGLPNPYRLRPLVGARIPVNASYEPMIMIHNPHETRIQVVEMLSSGADFGLELPDEVNEQEAVAAWAIEPFQTKPLMKGSFQGKTEGNHTGYIKIKVNHTAVAVEYLLVPVEVQVSSAPGIYSPQDSLDFGLLVQSDKPKTLSLSLINAQASPVNVQSVTVKGDPNPALRIEFRPLIIEPDISVSTVVALITFDPSQVSSVQQSNGFIEINSECGKSITVPFQATVMQGELEYNASSLGFFVKADNVPARNFSVRNNFSSAVAIYQVTVNHPDIVQVDNLNQSHVIIPGEQKTIFTFKVHKKAELCDSKSRVQLIVKSNITDLKLPIICYDGKLHLHSVEEGQIDFGRVELYSTYTEYFSVENRNPVEIRLKSWGSNSSINKVELVGMQKGVKEDLVKIRDFDGLKKSLFLQPGHMAVFSIDIRRPTVEGLFYGESYVTTDHNQTLRIPFRFVVSKGSVHGDTIFFDKAFPGKISYEKLHLSSTFNQTVNLLGLRSHPMSSVWFSPSTLQEYPEISPHRKSFVGKVHFDPRKFCGEECYSGFVVDSHLGKKWVRGMRLNWEAGEVDSDVWTTLQNRFQGVKDATVSNISLWVDTSGLTGFKVKAQVRYIWPRMCSSRVVVFPLTALGNDSAMNIPISNPSSSPIIVQATLASQYGSSWSQFIHGNQVGGNITEGGLVFSVGGLSSSSSHSNDSVIFDHVQKQLVQDVLGLKDNSSPGVTFFIPPGAKFFLNLKFKPISKDMASTLLLLRNNLTGIETVWMKGRAGTGQLTVGSGTPGSSLLFQLTEKLLQGCQTEPASKYVPPQLTVRRSFIARNIGEIPLNILSLEVYPPQGSFWSATLGSSSQLDACEGYGFRILNCHPFTLQPNQTHSIDIAFTPDFTLSKVVRSLRLTDSTGGYFNYSLVALIPSGMLSICASIIARPTWEPYFKYLLAVGAVVCVLAAAMMSYFEAGSVVSSTVVATVRVMPKETGLDGLKGDLKENTTKLDLKAVYDKVENRFKRNQKDTQKHSTVTNLPNPGNKFPPQSDNSTSVNNGNLRSRKCKKSSNEMHFSQNNLNKFVDKSNQNHLSRSNSHLSSADDISDSNSATNVYNLNSSNCSIVKKDKEKDKENSTLLASSGKKKKTSIGNIQVNQIQQPTQIVKQKKVQNKNETFSGSSLPGKNKHKVEEETSSTTTESSNPDDFNIPFCEKDHRHSSKAGSDTKRNKAGKKDKPERMKDPDATDNICSSMEYLSSKNFDDGRKKHMGKKKENNGSSMIFNNVCGNVSPKQEMSLWDTPRPPSGDGLIELAAQTEAFGMQRPNRRNNSGGELSGAVVGLGGSMSNINIGCVGGNISNQLQSMHHVSGVHMNQQQNRPKKPGVIGQPRVNPNLASHGHLSSSSGPQPLSSTASASAFPNGMHHFASPSSSGSGTASGIGNIMNRQTSPTGRSISNPNNNPGSIWGSDILPDNGCDIWGRRPLDSSTTSSHFISNHSDNVYTRPSNSGIGGPYHQSMPSGYGAAVSSSAAMCNNISENNYTARVSPSSAKLVSQSGTGRNNGSGLTTGGGTDASYLFNGGITNEILNNLWQINASSYGDLPQYHSHGFVSGQQQMLQQQPQYGGTSSGTGVVGQHGYLQRMRSDPTVRSQQRGVPSAKNWSSSTYGEVPTTNRRVNQNLTIHPMGTQSNNNAPDGSSLWPANTTNPIATNIRSPSADSTGYGEWGTIGQSPVNLAQSESEIWEGGIVTSTSNTNKWPTSYGGASFQNSFTDSMAVGSGSRSGIHSRPDESNASAGPLSDLGLRGRSTDMTQNLREVEAGLGFNPFTSDIWNHSEGQGKSWNNSYDYSSNE